MAIQTSFAKKVTWSAAYGQKHTRRVVLAEPIGAVDGEQLREPRAGTIDPALHRPYRALGRL
jgi:hypothetical protein